jgi:hypothetical protein
MKNQTLKPIACPAPDWDITRDKNYVAHLGECPPDGDPADQYELARYAVKLSALDSAGVMCHPLWHIAVDYGYFKPGLDLGAWLDGLENHISLRAPAEIYELLRPGLAQCRFAYQEFQKVLATHLIQPEFAWLAPWLDAANLFEAAKAELVRCQKLVAESQDAHEAESLP